MIARPSKEPHLDLGSFTSLGSTIVGLCIDVFVIFKFLGKSSAIELNVHSNVKTRTKVR